ncbi:MAG: galactose oxidase early set domain-containing protein, partial [Nitrososphaera sp.]|nr:galactose oxidase early set domain-containing protein [Nitrososphaera sp.]
ALLLPDGRVLSAGSGRFGVDQFSAEIYSPPYLFNGPRPVITSAPTTLQYGTNFTVATPDASRIASVSLIRLGSVTHAFNFEQRFMKLAFLPISGGLDVQPPASENLAPPGYYMLFLVDNIGVPSVASFIRFP